MGKVKASGFRARVCIWGFPACRHTHCTKVILLGESPCRDFFEGAKQRKDTVGTPIEGSFLHICALCCCQKCMPTHNFPAGTCKCKGEPLCEFPPLPLQVWVGARFPCKYSPAPQHRGVATGDIYRHPWSTTSCATTYRTPPRMSFSSLFLLLL